MYQFYGTDRNRNNNAGDTFERQIRSHLEAHPERVSRLEVPGQFIWVKRPESPGLVRRLQKGNPQDAFERERRAMHQLKAEGAPIPDLVAEGEDFLAIADSGTPLSRILKAGLLSADDREACFDSAGKALAGLHGRHLSHGRPNLKDICWNDGRITFLDFERYSARRNTPKGHMQDLVMFVFNAFAIAGQPTPETDAAIAGYRAADPADIWQQAVHWCAKRRWIDWVTKPIQLTRKSPEFKAIPLTLDAFGARA